ncbi:Asp23/Gls24 family envelope stress response protein [Streptomyces profundus]|uniref:Asp23/Gls24 family envelope stress response protein n=1 Tax=Streptomyces profundus TaxID=2867410 RepID=UPI001D16E172|nr:Asp23/Gls24 family envelope stress response protein [Streptomyces sp. MA3_2.13]UED83852.1 Asp23/Gls24 family envelope stress response protein [Streptomyces sp. MA3_2.13]
MALDGDGAWGEDEGDAPRRRRDDDRGGQDGLDGQGGPEGRGGPEGLPHEAELWPSAVPADDEELLACGRSLVELWEAWDEGRATRDPHVVGCPYCGAALAELRSLGELVARSRAEEDRVPEAPGLASRVTARVMEIVRLELRPGRTLPLGEPNEDAWIVEAAVSRVFRSAVEELDGVRAGSCRIAPISRVPVGEGPPRGPVAVRIEVVAALSWSVPVLAEAIRRRLAVAADEELGLDVRTIDVHVLDLTDEPPRGDRRLR